jgi:hypothetical protein
VGTTATSTVAPAPVVPTRPYAPSWANVFTAWMERLPGPTWLAYVTGLVLLELVSVVAAEFDPAMQANGIGSAMYYGALPIAALALIHSLDRTASGALETLRPDLDMDEREIAQARHQLTVAPARAAWLIALFSVVITTLGYVSDPVGTGISGYSPAALAFRWFWESLITAIFLVLVYHTVRQLRLIARIHERVRRVDVFDQGRLYAMSRVTSRTAIGLVVLLAPSLFLLPAAAGVSYWVITVGWYASAVAIATAAFFLPLWGMHGRLVAEKDRLQAEGEARLKLLLAQLNGDIDTGDLGRADALNKTIASMLQQREVLAKLPTWPWSASTLRGFMTAILLPIALFLIQRFLSQVV